MAKAPSSDSISRKRRRTAQDDADEAEVFIAGLVKQKIVVGAVDGVNTQFFTFEDRIIGSTLVVTVSFVPVAVTVDDEGCGILQEVLFTTSANVSTKPLRRPKSNSPAARKPM